MFRASHREQARLTGATPSYRVSIDFQAFVLGSAMFDKRLSRSKHLKYENDSSKYNSLRDASVGSRGSIQMMLKSAFFARRNEKRKKTLQ